MFLVSGEIIFRLFGSYIPGSVEIITYYLIVGIAYLPLGQIEQRGDMIAMDVFSAIAGRRVNSAMNWSNGLTSVLVYAVLTVATWEFAWGKMHDGAYVLTSTYALISWPAYFLPPVAFALATLTTLLRTIFGPSAVRPSTKDMAAVGEGD
nr:TRAP transporter small permease subunit [Rhodobacter sp. NTK016B]